MRANDYKQPPGRYGGDVLLLSDFDEPNPLIKRCLLEPKEAVGADKWPLQQTLDDFVWEDTVFRHIRVVYKGGLLRIKENVHFEDCLFNIVDSPAGEKLAGALFMSNHPRVELDPQVINTEPRPVLFRNGD